MDFSLPPKKITEKQSCTTSLGILVCNYSTGLPLNFTRLQKKNPASSHARQVTLTTLSLPPPSETVVAVLLIIPSVCTSAP